MKMNVKILLLSGLIFGFNSVHAVCELSQSQSTKNIYDEQNKFTKLIITTKTTMSDGTVTTEVVEKSPTGEVLTTSSEVTVDEKIKATGYINEAIISQFMAPGNKEDWSSIVKGLVNLYGIDINKLLVDGITPAHFLMATGQGHIIHDLLLSPDINFETRTARGHTVRDVAQLALDGKGETELGYINKTLETFFSGFFPNIENAIPTAQEVASCLSFFGIDLNKTISGDIAIIHFLANSKNSPEGALAIILAIPGLNLEAKTSRGHTALDLARLAGNDVAAELIQDALAKQIK